MRDFVFTQAVNTPYCPGYDVVRVMQEHEELLAGDSVKIPLLLLRLNTDLSDSTLLGESVFSITSNGSSIILCIPLSKSPQAFSQAGIGLEAEVLFQGLRVGVGHGHVTWLHGHELLVGLEVVVLGQHAGTDQLFLQDGHEVKKVLGGVVTYVIYFVRRNRKTILTILLLWSVLHNTDYTFYDVIDIGEVTLAVAVVENLYGFAFHKFVGETEVCHVRATDWTIDGEETETC